MTANIRKLVIQVDETRKEMGRDITPPRAARWPSP